MAVAIDFGTCNTVLARWNEAEKRVNYIRLESLHRKFSYRRPEDKKPSDAYVIPSLIHYGENDKYLIGEQVAAAGLVDHRATFLWVKLDMLRNNAWTRRVNGRIVSCQSAATDLLKRILLFASGSVGAEDDFIFTMPVEAFDHYINWLQDTALTVLKRDVRVLDEATACILGYEEQVRDDEVYAIFDFGGGTLDIAIVKTALAGEGRDKCRLMGRAGEELGGVLVDKWMLEEMKAKEGLGEQDIADVGAVLLREIEKAKIEISSGAERKEIMCVNDITGRMIRHTFTKGDLARIMREKNVDKMISRTIDRAVEAAQSKYGVRKSQIKRVFMVGGSSLLLGVAEQVEVSFSDSTVRCENPFEAIAGGACRFIGQDVIPTLVHDYCLSSWNRGKKDYELKAVVSKGTQFPTDKPVTVKYLNAACHGADSLGLVIYERAYMERPDSSVVVGPDGRIQVVSSGAIAHERVRPLNPADRQFIFAVPACDLDDEKRFVIGFGVDRNKRLTIWLKDTKEGNKSYIKTVKGEIILLPVKDFPIVRL